jgi:PAS domain S-box-containing protein
MHNLLLVDDEVIIAAELEDRLTANGYRVVGIATTGARAVAMARERKPDLIIMDIMMPGDLDGIDAAQIIRSRFDIPVIFLTAFADDQLMKRAKAVRPLGYILKPFNENQITATISVALHNNALEKLLKESEARYRAVVETLGDYIIRFDPGMKLLFANSAFLALSEKFDIDPSNCSLEDLLPMSERHHLKQIIHGAGPSASTLRFEHPIVIEGGQRRWIQWSIQAFFEAEGGIREFQAVGRDITDHVVMEKMLRQLNVELESRVKQRTHELEIKTASLEEVNTALGLLLKKREEDKLEIEKRVLTNVHELVLPFIEKVKRYMGDHRARGYLEVIESNLNDIISPFAHTISTKYTNLTPTEVKVASLIKQGLATKEIADLLALSGRTIEAYRNNIRKKLGIKNKKVNLRTYLHPVEDFQIF